MQLKEKFPSIFLIDDKLATQNMLEGFRPFGEQLVKIKGKEYRLFDPNRSKLAAAIMKGISETGIKKGDKILYMGVAHGFTASFISDIVGEKGIIYGIEFSERCFQDLIPLCEKRKSLVPILADARLPEQYEWIEKCDVVYCDIAQPDQTQVAMRNCRKFLKAGGYLLLAIKARSIDVTKSPRKIVEEEIEKLKGSGFEIIDWKMLDPFELDHGFIIARMK